MWQHIDPGGDGADEADIRTWVAGRPLSAPHTNARVGLTLIGVERFVTQLPYADDALRCFGVPPNQMSEN